MQGIMPISHWNRYVLVWLAVTAASAICSPVSGSTVPEVMAR